MRSRLPKQLAHRMFTPRCHVGGGVGEQGSSSSSSPAPPVAYSRSGGPPLGHQHGRSLSRSRAPSDPYGAHMEGGPYSPSPISIGSPHGAVQTYSRPQSRQEQQQGFRRMGSESPEPRQYEVVRGRQNVNPATGLMSPPPSDLSETSFGEEGFPGLNTLPMPRFNDGGEDSDEDSDEDREDTALGLVHERTITASSISLDLQERLDAQHKVNNDLRKKLTEAEDTLQRKLSEHEADLEGLQTRIEDLRSELSATKRQEKELRGKEVSVMPVGYAMERNA